MGGGGGGATLFLTLQRGVRTNFFLFWRGVLTKFSLDNSSFSPPPLLIIIAQSLSGVENNSVAISFMLSLENAKIDCTTCFIFANAMTILTVGFQMALWSVPSE